MPAAILREAVSLATVEGLEGLSIGTLAAALDMSKSGLYADFGSKQELQLATIEEADRVFEVEVIEPALAAPAGSRNSSWCATRSSTTSGAGGSPAAASSWRCTRMSARPGPVNERIVAFQISFVTLIRQFVVSAQELGQLADDEDPDQLTFELNGIILAANTNFALHQDPRTLDLARQVVRRRLGVKSGSIE